MVAIKLKDSITIVKLQTKHVHNFHETHFEQLPTLTPSVADVVRHHRNVVQLPGQILHTFQPLLPAQLLLHGRHLDQHPVTIVEIEVDVLQRMPFRRRDAQREVDQVLAETFGRPARLVLARYAVAQHVFDQQQLQLVALDRRHVRHPFGVSRYLFRGDRRPVCEAQILINHFNIPRRYLTTFTL